MCRLIYFSLLLLTAHLCAIGQCNQKISFSGYTWQVKSGFYGPGPNHFSSDNVYVDRAGHLHLKVSKTASNTWTAAEVSREEGLQYGTYTWTVRSDVSNLDPNLVLGLFTWDTRAPQFAYREIDFEVAKWGVVGRKDNSQFVIQPYARPNHLKRFQQNIHGTSTWKFTWSPGKVVFSVSDGSKVVSQWEYRGADVPPSGGGGPHINLWMFENKAPHYGRPVEVIIEKFTFSPLRVTTDETVNEFGLAAVMKLLWQLWI